MESMEQGGLSANERAIMEKELPGRSLLEQSGELALSEKQREINNDLLVAESILDEHGREAWRKDIRYVTRDGQLTDEVKAITEATFARDEEAQTVDIMGTNLDREHSWHATETYDEAGNLVKQEGAVTEGERQGETWDKTRSIETIGDYTKITETNTGKEMQDGKLVNFTTVEVHIPDPNGDGDRWGYHEHNGQRTMEWGTKPEDLDIE